jgi:hypothetical protein
MLYPRLSEHFDRFAKNIEDGLSITKGTDRPGDGSSGDASSGDALSGDASFGGASSGDASSHSPGYLLTNNTTVLMLWWVYFGFFVPPKTDRIRCCFSEELIFSRYVR